MVLLLLLLGVILGFVFRRRIQQWLEGLEGPIGRMRGNRREDGEMGDNNMPAYNYNNINMVNPNTAYVDPNANYRIPPPQNYQPNMQAYYAPPPQQLNPYETEAIKPTTSRVQLSDASKARTDTGINPYER